MLAEQDLLYDAEFALDALACGEDPGYVAIVSGVSALEAVLEDPSSLGEGQLAVLEAAHRLLDLANECELPLDGNSRIHAAQLACSLRKSISSSRE